VAETVSLAQWLPPLGWPGDCGFHLADPATGIVEATVTGDEPDISNVPHHVK